MKKFNFPAQMLGGLLLVPIILIGCGQRIAYRLDNRDIVMSESTKPLKVEVATFVDERQPIERQKKERKKASAQDASDYTYDNEFEGIVAAGISQMIVKHLAFSRAFKEVTLSEYSSDQIEPEVLNSLRKKGVDMVLTGRIQNFYGYYDRRPGNEIGLALLFGLGFGIPTAFLTIQEETTQFGSFAFTERKTNQVAISIATAVGTSLGSYLESTAKRNIERHNKFFVQLVSTSTREVAWQGAFEVSEQIKKSMPGFNSQSRKYQVAIVALRESVNQMVTELSKNQLRAGN